MGSTAPNLHKPRDLRSLNKVHRYEQRSFELASIGSRFLAITIDGFLYTTADRFILSLLQVNKKTGGLGLLMIAFALLILLYVVPMTLWDGQTFGKKILKIRVISQDRQPLGLDQIFIREVFGRLLSIMLMLSGYVMALFDTEKKTLHDRLAKTFVVKVQSR